MTNDMRDELREILSGECERRWMEGKNHNYCGHPLPCPHHSDIKLWAEERIIKILAWSKNMEAINKAFDEYEEGE